MATGSARPEPASRRRPRLPAGPWRTTPFRLAVGFGAAYLFGVALLLGAVYLRTSGYLARRTDAILQADADRLARSTPDALPGRLDEEERRSPLDLFALYSETGQRVAGGLTLDVAELPPDGRIREFARLDGRAAVRVTARRLPWGETLAAGRDAGQLVELRRVLLAALGWGGAAVAALGVGAGVALGREPLARVQAMRHASERIVAGDLSARLPAGDRGDELDEMASIVNAMMAEIERLMTQARAAGESVAHELRTPLTRLRATLEHAGEGLEGDEPRRRLLELCLAEADGVLARFRALLRIAAVEARRREAEIGPVDLSALVLQAAELYQPLAAEKRVGFEALVAPGLAAHADGELLFEAIANLLDNAIKFTPAGGRVALRLAANAPGAVLEVADTGAGVTPEDLPLLTRRFYRAPRHSGTPGHGLGLSLVAAVAELHGFDLDIRSGDGGTTVRLRLA